MIPRFKISEPKIRIDSKNKVHPIICIISYFIF